LRKGDQRIHPLDEWTYEGCDEEMLERLYDRPASKGGGESFSKRKKRSFLLGVNRTRGGGGGEGIKKNSPVGAEFGGRVDHEERKRGPKMRGSMLQKRVGGDVS